VGCGLGAWLASFRTHGVTDIRGLDRFDPGERLKIPRDLFGVIDLEHPAPVNLQVDLALCLEVAEHLHEEAAQPLIDLLVAAAPVVAFSAGIPCQHGLGHVNLQWPEYWRSRFALRGYRQLDMFRAVLWEDRRVSYWYRQNLFLYANEAWIADHPDVDTSSRLPERLVHPLLLLQNERSSLEKQGLHAVLAALPGALRRSVAQRRSG
jgi:hypothetical protein